MSELILDPRHTAVVVIDLQKGISRFEGAPHSTAKVIENCVSLLAAARESGAQPVLVHVDFSPMGADALHVTSDEPMRATTNLPFDWSEFLPELDRQFGDIVILKRQWGAFYGTDLEFSSAGAVSPPSFSAESQASTASKARRATPTSAASSRSSRMTP